MVEKKNPETTGHKGEVRSDGVGLSERNHVCSLNQMTSEALTTVFVWLLLSSSTGSPALHWFSWERFNAAGSHRHSEAGSRWGGRADIARLHLLKVRKVSLLVFPPGLYQVCGVCVGMEAERREGTRWWQAIWYEAVEGALSKWPSCLASTEQAATWCSCV